MKKIFWTVILCSCILSACGAEKTVEKEDESPAAERVVVSTPEEVPENTEKPQEQQKNSEEEKIPSEKTETEEPASVQTPAPVQEIPKAEEATTQEALSEKVCVKIVGLDIFSLEQNVELSEGMTALDATLLAVRDTQYNVDYSGGKSAAYIKGIGGLYEKQHGAMSGWCYSVNGERASKSCGKYKLNAGDVLEWKYCLDFTE